MEIKKIKKVLIVFGTRPEAIKMAPLIKEFKKYPESFDLKVCVTAQHREMLDQVLRVFNIIPDYDLNIMVPNQDLFEITSKVMLGVRDVLKEFRPEVVLVHGDTTTAMAASIASFYMQIKIGHIEAGLRTYNLNSPWPEEMNRQVTDRICDYYFSPTENSRDNLLKEMVSNEKIFVTGNTVVDALLLALEIIENDKSCEEEIKEVISIKGFNVSNSIKNQRQFILVTGHRRESFGEGFLNICNAIKTLAINHPEIDIVYPVHLNPNVQKTVFNILSNLSNVYLIPPVDYLPFIFLMNNCSLILTDSGGIQEEAPSLDKPVLVMRESTERPEAVNAGTAILVGTNEKSIIYNVEKLLKNKEFYNKMVITKNPYGDGLASQRIVKELFSK